MLLMALCASAVEPPATSRYFHGYFHGDAKASETEVTGKALKPYGLDVYRGVTITDSPDAATTLEKAVATDAHDASDREIAYRDGRIYYAFMTLKPLDGKNRYVFYLNQHLVGGDKIILIYMKGKANAEQIKKIIKK